MLISVKGATVVTGVLLVTAATGVAVNHLVNQESEPVAIKG